MEARKKVALEDDDCELYRLPSQVLHGVFSRLDVGSLCAAAASCRLLRLAVTEFLPYLPALDFEEISPDKRVLDLFLRCNSSLRSLKLDCGLLDDTAISLVTKSRLEELSLQNCDSFSQDVLLKQIGLHCRRLRCLNLSLDVRTVRRSFINGFKFLLEKCTLLTTLSVRGLWNSGEYQVSGELQKLEYLEVLEIGYFLEHEAIHMIRSRAATPAFAKLQRLSLVLDQISDILADAISRNLNWLIELELWDEPRKEPSLLTDLTNSGIQNLGNLSNLRRLSIVRSWAVHPAASFKRVNDLGIFLMAEYCQQLESIRLGGFSRITDAGCWALLSACGKLHTFELLNTSQLTDLAFHNLSSTIIHLKSVNLSSSCLISDDAVRHLAFCRSLEVLNLKGCSSIQDDSLMEIANLTELRVLLLDGSQVSDVGLHRLARGKMQLISFSLRGCSRVTDEGIIDFVAGPVARTLQSVDLSGIPKVGDPSVVAIAENSVPVVELWLRNCQMLGDAAVEALASMHTRKGSGGGTLRLLDVWNCRKLSKKCIRWFMRPHFPRLRKLGLTRASPMDLKRLKADRRYMQVHLRGAELGRRRGEGDWMAKSGGKYEKQDELERWLEVEDEEEDYEDDNSRRKLHRSNGTEVDCEVQNEDGFTCN